MSGDQPFYPASTDETRSVSVLGHPVGRVWKSTDTKRPGVMAADPAGVAVRDYGYDYTTGKAFPRHRVFPDIQSAAEHLILLWGSAHCAIEPDRAPTMTPALPEENR